MRPDSPTPPSDPVPAPTAVTPDWPAGDGAMAARLRAHDWAASALGPVAAWPASLRGAVQLCLDAALPTAVLWGDALFTFPNDALAARWPAGTACPLGEPYAGLQPLAWGETAPALAEVLATGRARSVPGFWRGQDLSAARGDSFACTPLRDDAGAVRGLVACATGAPAREAIERLVHQLRDPLAPLRNSLELLRMSRDGLEVALVHEMLERQVQSMVVAIDRLLVEPPPAGTDAGDGRGASPDEPSSLNAPPVTPWRPPAARGAARGVAPAAEPAVARPGPPARRATDPPGVSWARRRRFVERPAPPLEDLREAPASGDDLFDLAAAAVRAGRAGTEVLTLDAPVIARRVLVVDDHHDAADSLAMLLSHLGTEVRVAYDGEQALAILQDWRPEAVLLDLEMPGMDGFEVARRVRATPRLRGLPLVALSGLGQGTDMRRTRAAGINHHLVKPVRLDVLVQVLQSLDGDEDGADDGTWH